MPFNLRLLRVFLAVARHGTITRAAGDLGLTQPAVSRAVRELESQTRSVLLERTPSGVRLTPAGAALLAHARVIFAEVRAAEEDLEALDGLTRGTLRLGGSPTIATYLMPPLIRRFTDRYPNVELRLTTAPSRVVARLLVEREVDVALVETPVEDSRLRAALWAEDELVLVAAPMHPIAARTPVAPSVLARELLVIREPGSGTHDTVMGALRAHGVVPGQRLEVDTAEAMIQLVAAGVGVGFVSRCAVTDALALGRLVILPVAGVRILRPLLRLSLVAAGASTAARAFETLLDAPAPAGLREAATRSSRERPAGGSRRGAPGRPADVPAGAPPERRQPKRARAGGPGRP